jgi:photosystem II stability/assembly factor-like uncharacterized protein
MRALAAATLATLALVDCGGGDDPAAPATPAKARSPRLVDFSKKPPYVNTLDIDPGSGDFLLTTNRGFWRIASDGSKVTPIRGTVSDGGKTAPVGTFLEIRSTGSEQLLGSGHPDQAGALPSFLGLLRSADGGKTWTVVARLGDADLHKIVLRHNRLYAFDAILSAMLISSDGGKTFTEEFTPRGLIIDFEVDPADPKRIIASTEEELFRTEDGGRTWRPLSPGKGIRLAWPEPDTLYRAEADGSVQASGDGGTSWRDVGSVDGEPYELHATGPKAVFLVLSDGSILETTDGGARWRDRFRP